MKKSTTAIPYYREINDFLETIPVSGRTTNPNFYCLRLRPLKQHSDIYRSPYRRAFYFFGLFKNDGKIKIGYNANTVDCPDTYLLCHSPELVYSFSKGDPLEGYIIYFKPECFSFFKPDFHNEFPFFNRLYTNLFTLNRKTFYQLTPYFEGVFSAYETNDQEQHIEARLKLLALLYHVKGIVRKQHETNRLTSPQQVLLNNYISLVNNHYIEKRTVQEYAELLSVTTNHLSQTVKVVSGKNALSYILERSLREAMSLLAYTDFSVSEIAYQLGFTNPSHFGKFFKKETGMPPSKFRLSRSKKLTS